MEGTENRGTWASPPQANMGGTATGSGGRGYNSDTWIGSKQGHTDVQPLVESGGSKTSARGCGVDGTEATSVP